MPPELETTFSDTETNKQYSDEEITKILNTAQATRKERDETARRAKELETKVAELSSNLEKIKGIDPIKYKELEIIAANYEERKLEEQRNFGELQTRYKEKENALLQENQQLKESNRQQAVVNALEKSFYATGGKSGKDDDGLTYFDLIRDRAANYIVLDDQGKITVVDPRDKMPLKDTKGVSLTVDDLMLKLRSGGPTASLFEPIGNGAGSGMVRSHGIQNKALLREQIKNLPRAEQLTKARELGL
jgi:hypothetical protein